MSDPSSSQIRVRYAETDQMGVAYHGQYTSHAAVDRGGRPRRLPEELRRRLA